MQPSIYGHFHSCRSRGAELQLAGRQATGVVGHPDIEFFHLDDPMQTHNERIPRASAVPNVRNWAMRDYVTAWRCGG